MKTNILLHFASISAAILLPIGANAQIAGVAPAGDFDSNLGDGFFDIFTEVHAESVADGPIPPGPSLPTIPFTVTSIEDGEDGDVLLSVVGYYSIQPDIEIDPDSALLDEIYDPSQWVGANFKVGIDPAELAYLQNVINEAQGFMDWLFSILLNNNNSAAIPCGPGTIHTWTDENGTKHKITESGHSWENPETGEKGFDPHTEQQRTDFRRMKGLEGGGCLPIVIIDLGEMLAADYSAGLLTNEECMLEMELLMQEIFAYNQIQLISVQIGPIL